MEENNNDEKTILDKGKEVAKNETKKIASSITKKVVVWAAPAIGIFFLILLAIGVIQLIPYLIQMVFSSILGIFNTTQADAVVSSESQSIISLVDGAYKINEEDISEQILEELEKQKVNTEVMGFDTENLDDMLNKYIKAEMKTMYPKTEMFGNDMDGSIVIKRILANSETEITLKYAPYDDFVKKGSDEILKYFSLTDDFKLCIAHETDSTQYKDFDGKDINIEESTQDSTIKIEEIDYQTSIQNYATPFNFFISLHVIAQDAEFMDDLVKTILDASESIVLTYVDSQIITTTEKFYTGAETIISEDIKYGIDYQSYEDDESYDTLDIKLMGKDDIEMGDAVAKDKNGKWICQYIEKVPSTSKGTDIDNDNVKEYDTENDEMILEDWQTKIRIQNTGNLYVTKADTWIKKSEKTIQRVNSPEEEPETISGPTVVKNLAGEIVDITEAKYYHEQVTVEIDGQEEKLPIYQSTKTTRNIQINEEITQKSQSTSYTVVEGDGEIKVDADDPLMQLLDKYPNVKNNLTSAPSNLFYLLAQNENTQQLEQVMRYVIFKLTDEDYGVTDKSQLEFLLTDSDFNYVSAYEIFKQYLRYWEHAQISNDGEYYIIRQDSEGNLTVGYGISIEENKVVLEQAGYTLAAGEKIDRDVVDTLEETKINNLTKEVKAFTSGLDLTNYQINALVSRCYENGVEETLNELRGSPAKTFEEAYKAYWNPEDDLYENSNDSTVPTVDYNHSLYTQYMSANANNESASTSLTQRRNSEWILFQTGYYQEIGIWYPKGNAIVAIAEEIHRYMEENNYTYCVYGGNKYEECETFGKSHGLNSTFEASKTKHQNTCCATFVSWVLQEAGYVTAEEHSSNGLNGANNMKKFLIDKGWEVISCVSELEPGDIVCYNRHVEIYAGDGTVYTAGSGSSIRGAAPRKKDVSAMICGLRAPN